MVTTRRGKEENTTAPYHAELQQRPKGSSSEALSGGINKKQWVATRGQASSQSVTCCSARNVGRRTGEMDANVPRAPSKQNLESGTLIASGCWFVSGCQRVGALAKWKIHALPSLIEDTKKWEMESSSEQVASLMFWSWHRHRNSSAVPLFFHPRRAASAENDKWIAILLHMTSIITPFDDDSAASVEARKVREQQNW